MKQSFLFIILFSFFSYAQPDVTLQVLGSGGPESGDKRASSGYLIWIDGKSKVLIDFGGGTSLRFEEVGARIEDLDVILLTHLHVDHTADLPALLKSSFFTRASGNLYIYGPDKNNFMPSTSEFVNRLFKEDDGAWQYLGDHLDGRAELQLKVSNIVKNLKESMIFNKNGISISAVSVHHGPIPAIAYRVNTGNKSITFSGDMNGEYHTLETLAKNSDILVAHNAVTKGSTGVAAKLHMTPYIIGEIAKKAQVKKLVLSHRMLRTLGKESSTKSEIRKHYKGTITFADDKSLYRIN
ncbi:MAG: MBL fold metallo-hydrolase [Sulfurovum sp.]|uniref:MBL fold metallo-hydrolase n=1 Tax=Sulfurovum sp. TaxID=1969726 RepID=UPI002868322A|nr:MBL fold metallo-hydrolase [Sulfurovum sp.]MCO4846034.1 MBL fold metallo-hydrolase [Sulfurovum sp.]